MGHVEDSAVENMRRISNLYRRLRALMGRISLDPGRGGIADVGFHSDSHLIALVLELVESAKAFVETGTNVGSTTRYVGKLFPDMPVYSCELDEGAYRSAMSATKSLKNVHLFNLGSQEFLPKLYSDCPWLATEPVLFWLDAHGYGFDWPLRFEIDFISQRQESGVLLIDDCLVPGQPQFKFDTYQDQVCSLDYVRDSFAPGRGYTILYPKYTERTSPHHPLTGYAAVMFGDRMSMPSATEDRYFVKELRK
jgi:hypothetical protein